MDVYVHKLTILVYKHCLSHLHSEEKESTTKKIEELQSECDSVRSQLAEVQAARDRAEGEKKELEAKMSEEKEQRESEMQRLEADASSRQEDIQAKDKLIQKVLMHTIVSWSQ